MKKLILVGGLLLVAAGCSQTTVTNNTTTTTTTSGLQTYTNGTYGFQFQYPTNMQFVTPQYALLEDKVVELRIPQSDYPKTNFGDAAFSVSAAYTTSLSSCLSLNAPEGSDGFKTQVQINGTTFYMTKGGGAAAGNRYNSMVYRALVGKQTCVELNEMIHTAVIDNFPAGTVTEVDSNAVQARLDAILNTFKFQ